MKQVYNYDWATTTQKTIIDALAVRWIALKALGRGNGETYDEEIYSALNSSGKFTADEMEKVLQVLFYGNH